MRQLLSYGPDTPKKLTYEDSSESKKKKGPLVKWSTYGYSMIIGKNIGDPIQKQ